MSEELNQEEAVVYTAINNAEEAPVESEPAPAVETVVEEVVHHEAPAEEITAITTADISNPSDTVQSVGSVVNGVIGVAQTPRPIKKAPAAKAPVQKEETVAVFSTRNVTWNGVGTVYRGYNIVKKSAADKWLTRDHIRLATPEEVAQEFKK